MSERKHPPLNDISVCDRFRVNAYSHAQDVHFLFQSCGPMSPNRPAEFTCHLYDSAELNHAAYIAPDTLPLDSSSDVRSCAKGRTLEELIHNLDWAHKPSELAQLKALLATRALTNCGEPVGDLVLLALTPEQREQQTQVLLNRSQTLRADQEARITEAALAAIRAAANDAEHVARFGLRKAIHPELGSIAAP